MTTVDKHLHVCSLSVVGAGVITDDDRAVGLDEQSGAIGETDACSAAGLSLDSVAGVELGIAIGGNVFSCGGPDYPDVSLKRDKPRAGGVFHFGDVFEGIAVFPDVEGSAGGHAAEDENGDSQINEALLNNPPIKSKTTGSIRYH